MKMSESKWVQMYGEYEISGLSILEFSKVVGIAESTFYKYRKKYSSIDVNSVCNTVVETHVNEAVNVKPVTVVPITVVKKTSVTFECNGYRISLDDDLTDDILSRIIRATK